MKYLYDENHKYTHEALDLADEAQQALMPIFKKWLKEGYSPREISHIIQATTNETELETILGQAAIH